MNLIRANDPRAADAKDRSRGTRAKFADRQNMSTTASYIKNPISGRDIKVGGPTYEKLKVQYQLQKAERFTKALPRRRYSSGPMPEEQLRRLRRLSVYSPDIEAASREVTQPYLIRRAASYKRGGRGSSTRGWALDAPKRGVERHQLKQQCGNRCFLLPEEEAFPICPRCRGDKCACKADCRGITAAKVRAHQYKYENLYEPIDSLLASKCGR